MKKLFILSIILISCKLFAQEKDTTYWQNKFKTGLTFNLSDFSENWKGGSNSSIAIGGLFIGKSMYQRDKIEWVSQSDLQFGKIKTEPYDHFRKSVDKLLMDTKIGYRLNKKWNAFSSLSLLTQFGEGKTYFENDSSATISDIFAPAYLTSTWGLEYKPNDFFYARISPFSPRFTFVRDTTLYRYVPENYGVKVGETSRREWKAFKFIASFDKNLMDNISLKADYELFANLEDFNFDKIDHRIDLVATAKLYKFLNLTLTSNIIKDIDQIDVKNDEKKWQAGFQVGLSILLNYSNQKPSP